MHSYYIEECEPEIGVIRGPKIGVLESEQLTFGGRLITNDQIGSLVVKNLNGDIETDASVTLTLAPKLQQELNLSSDQSILKFDVALNRQNLRVDYHFNVYAIVNSLEILLFSGFIQPVELPKTVLFIVGSPRSGTSALGKACRIALAAQAHGESHVIEGIYKALQDTELFFEQSVTANINGNLVNTITRTVMLAEHLSMLRRIYKLYYGNTIHLDKTPGIPMLQSLPFALMAWPNAQVIFCKRRAMENIQSRLIKFPKVKFLQHAKQWKQSFVAWRKARQTINQLLKRNDWFVEVDQFDMALSPLQVSENLSLFLGLNKRENKRLLAQLSSNDRPEQTSKPSTNIKSLDDFGWTKSQLVQFKEHCEKEMKHQNYSFDSTYYIESNSIGNEE